MSAVVAVGVVRGYKKTRKGKLHSLFEQNVTQLGCAARGMLCCANFFLRQHHEAPHLRFLCPVLHVECGFMPGSCGRQQ